MNKYKKVIDLIRKEDVTLFIGSGCSIGSKAPFAKELSGKIWTLLDAEFQDEDTKTSLQDVAECLVVQEGNDRTKLNGVLKDSFSSLIPSSFHKLLIQIPHFHTIITTNYDSLIETAYGFDYFQVIASDTELVAADSKKVQLLKIHGDLKHLEDIIITKTDYRHFLETPKHSLLWSRVTTEFTSKHIVFVGYSADDQNILNLIENIRNKTSGVIKKMYLIAPSLKAVQKKRLEDLGAIIINGTGEEFLQNVISSLKESFGEDRYNNICSQDTLNRFALLNGVQFAFENDGKHTRFPRWSSLDGNPCPLKMSFSTKSKDIIGGRAPMTIKNIVKGFDLPVYALTKEELSTFRMSVNDLCINGKDEMAQVLIGPEIEEIDITFTTANRDIVCRSKAKKYSEKGVCHILIPTPMFNIELNINASDTSKDMFAGTLTTKLNEGQFADLEKAINWSKLLVCLEEGVGITLHIGHFRIDNLSFSNQNELLPRYNDWLEYCTNLSDIEVVTNNLMTYYDGFTSDCFLYSKIVRSYLRHEAFIDRPRKEHTSFIIDVGKGTFRVNGDYLVRIVTAINGPVSLCGVDYPIAEERVLIRHCKIDSVECVDGEKERLHITNQQKTVQYEYCDKEEHDCIISKVSQTE